jgi:hypothetical protein
MVGLAATVAVTEVAQAREGAVDWGLGRQVVGGRP